MDRVLKSLDREVRRLLGLGLRDLTPTERRIILELVRRSAALAGPTPPQDDSPSFGQRLADQVAAIGGSWGFILTFALVLAAWIVGNAFALSSIGLRPFDPFPFVFLNLLLSMVAALQAPIIMMSQNRQAAEDRAAVEHDYQVNLKAELEIMGIHERLDRVKLDELAKLAVLACELPALISALQSLATRPVR
jgi:uncharacterized membrane protein